MVNSIRTKKILSHIVIVFIFSFVFAAVGTIGSAPTHAMSQICKVTGSTVFVRKDAGTEFDKVGSLKSGTYRLIQGSKKAKDGSTWYKVSVKSATGYISSKYAKKVQVSVSKMNKTTGTVNVSSGSLFARSGPGSLYDVTGKIAKGKQVTLTAKAKDINGAYWYQTKVNGKTAYVSAKYVTTGSSGSAAKATTKAKASTTKAKASTKVTAATTKPTAIKFKVTSVSKTTGKVNISSSILNVRSGPATSYSVLGSLKKNATFTVTGKTTVSGTTWYRLTYGKKTGYVSSKYVKTQATTTAKATTKSTTAAKASTTKSGTTTTAAVNRKASAKTLKARKAAVSWAINIANDNSFHYGESKWAHHFGCYYCGTNEKNSAKSKAGGSLDAISKTYCCNPFVTAAYAHGAGATEVSCTVSGKQINLAGSKNTVFKNDSWVKVPKPSKITSLEPGDILLTPKHALLYVGDSKVCHAASADDGKVNSTKWNNSIRVNTISTKHWSETKEIYRYMGTGKF